RYHKPVFVASAASSISNEPLSPLSLPSLKKKWFRHGLLASPPALVWEMFLQFLFLRIQHFLLQGRPLTRRQTQFLHPMMHNLVRFVHLALRHSGQFLLPPDQWRQRGAHQAYGANCSPEAPGRAIEMPARRSAEVSED